MKNYSRFTAAVFIFLAFYALCFLFTDVLFIHFDIGWHLELGNQIRRTGIIPSTDSWSSTAFGHRMVHWYWLWDIPASYLFELSGDFKPLIVATSLQVGLIAAIVFLQSHSTSKSILTSLLVAIFFGTSWFLCSKNVPSATISARTSAFLLFTISNYLLYRIAELERKNEVWLLIPILMIWINTHRLGTFILPLITLYALNFLAHRNYKGLITLSAATLLGVIAGFSIHPMGFRAYEMLLITGDPYTITTGGRSLDFANSPAVFYLITLFCCMLLCPAPMSLVQKLHLVLWLILGLKVTDATPLLLIVSAPFIATSLAQFKRSSLSQRLETAITNVCQLKSLCMLIVLSLLAGPTSYHYLSAKFPHGMDYPAKFYPLEGLQFLQTHYAGKKILTDWAFGGFIIHKTQGKIPVWVDGRGVGAYPLDVIYDASIFNFKPEEILNKYNPDVTFLRTQLPPNLFLQGNPEWKLTYTDSVVTIYERLNKTSTISEAAPPSP